MVYVVSLVDDLDCFHHRFICNLSCVSNVKIYVSDRMKVSHVLPDFRSLSKLNLRNPLL